MGAMKGFSASLAAAALLALASCQNMASKDFTVHTLPEGAAISINGEKVGTSPVTTKVEQIKDLGIVAEKEGYEVASATIPTKPGRIRSFLWTKWSSKSQYIEEDEVTLPLKRVEAVEEYKPGKLPEFKMPEDTE